MFLCETQVGLIWHNTSRGVNLLLQFRYILGIIFTVYRLLSGFKFFPNCY